MAYVTVRNAVQIGRAGEYLVCSSLELLGFQTALVNAQGYDVIFFDDEGEVYRVEVKSAKCKINQRYKFATSTGSASKKLLSPEAVDIVALVGLDEKVISYRDVMQVKHKRTTVSLSEFDQPEASQIRKAIESVRHRRIS